MKSSGIYCILNKVNSKRYVGSANDIKQRWAGHKCALRQGIHTSKHLQASWKKYGSESFSFEILEHCIPSVLIEREKWWINFYNVCSPKYGFNTKSEPNSSKGIIVSKEARENMSRAHMGQVAWNRDKWKEKFSEIDFQLFYQKGHTQVECAEYFNVSVDTVRMLSRRFGIARSVKETAKIERIRKSYGVKNIGRSPVNKGVISPAKGKPRAAIIGFKISQVKQIKKLIRVVFKESEVN